MTKSPSLAASYARWRASALGTITEAAEERVVFELAGPLSGRRALDIGTGDGAYAIEAARRGADVTGLDVDPAMLGVARKRAESAGVTLSLHEGRAEALPFGDDAFDVVFGVTVLCFVSDARQVVREMTRVLRPGGRLLLGELGRFNIWAAARRVRGWLGSSTWKRARFWSPSDLEALARDAGLRAIGVHGSVFFPPLEIAARLLTPFEPVLTRLHAPGAAFLVLTADKPVLAR